MNIIYKTIIYLTFPCLLLLGSGCKKEEEPNTANPNLVPEIGEWTVTEWTRTVYENNAPKTTETVTDIGSISLKDVNFGNVSEGFIHENKIVNSPVFFINPSPCYESFRWQSDEYRIAFIIGWCNHTGKVYSYTITGFGSNNQTWTRIETNTDGSQKLREVFKVKR
jgi:hypothetical protein